MTVAHDNPVVSNSKSDELASHTTTMSSPLNHKVPTSSQLHTTWCHIQRRITQTDLLHLYLYRFKCSLATVLKMTKNLPFSQIFHPKCFETPSFSDFLPQKTPKPKKKIVSYCFTFEKNGTVPRMNSKPSKNPCKTIPKLKLVKSTRFIQFLPWNAKKSKNFLLL